MRSWYASTTDQALLFERRNTKLPRIRTERQPGCTGQSTLGQRIAGHGNDPQKTLTFLGQIAHACQDHAVQAEGVPVG